MNSNPSRPSLVALNRSTRQNNVIIGNSAALSRSVSSSSVSIMESSPPALKDSLSHDPYVSISRAIQNVKLRAGSRIRNMSSAKFARSRHSALQTTARKATRALAVMFVILILVTLISKQQHGARNNIGFWHKLHVSAMENDSKNSPSLLHLLRHRPTATQTRNFDTGPWVVALVADLDKESCRIHQPNQPLRASSCSRANAWVSYLKRGVLSIPRLRGIKQQSSIRWLDERELVSHGRFEAESRERASSGGRAMELSEVSWFNGHLVTPDDHTGMLLEIMSPRGLLGPETRAQFYGAASNVPPTTFQRTHLRDGLGNDSNINFKAEWMAVKGDELYIGGHGKPFTHPSDGRRILSDNPRWVKVVDKDFKVQHVNWTDKYDALSKAAGVSFPGYVMHEAALWSAERSEWVFLPRRRSKEPFDPVTSERTGWNGLIIASEDFKKISTIEIQWLKDSTGLKGFSSAKFVPGTQDRLIVALRTIEVDPSRRNPKRETATFLSVFEIPSGKLVLAEERISNTKLEGIEFL